MFEQIKSEMASAPTPLLEQDRQMGIKVRDMEAQIETRLRFQNGRLADATQRMRPGPLTAGRGLGLSLLEQSEKKGHVAPRFSNPILGKRNVRTD